jgi:FKBP-type peptidyl-prolyl cis-trans isomerase FkpA
MSKNYSIKIITGFILLFSLNGCFKDEHQDKFNEELKILNQYLIDNEIKIRPTPSGLYYLEIYAGDEIFPEIGDYLLFNYTGRLLDGNQVYSSSNADTADFHGIYDPERLYGPFKLLLGYYAPLGVHEGLSYMTELGESRLIFPSNLGYGHEGYG